MKQFPLLFVLILAFKGSLYSQQRSYRLPGTDLKQPIIWGSTCEGPDGIGLSFGGQDQLGDVGIPPTRLSMKGEWRELRDELRKVNRLQSLHSQCVAILEEVKHYLAFMRRIHFLGMQEKSLVALLEKHLPPMQNGLVTALEKVLADIDKAKDGIGEYEASQIKSVRALLDKELTIQKNLVARLPMIALPERCAALRLTQITLEQVAEMLDAEPEGRALSPIVYEPKTKLFVLFGGDHCDYLTSTTWVFDPAKKRWMQRHPTSAPPPRANHKLTADGDGKVKLTGGYTYTNSTDYVGGQYRDLNDGEWTYDVENNTWKGDSKGVPPTTRTYRTGPFLPERYLEGDKPDAEATAIRLKELPINTWVRLNPPHRPPLNRDWGSVTYDPENDVLLRFSGGHSAHGGTDVIHYHLATNRWELPFPVEFPLGQLYSNTEYPEGFNLNGRPWVTGHTYQNYGYDPVTRMMLFSGQTRHCYFYDPLKADWIGRIEKPKAMTYGSCFYTLTKCPTPKGLVCWTQSGKLFRYEAKVKEWCELVLKGEKLPGSVVDNSTLTHDTKRDRLLFVSKSYGNKPPFDGKIHEVDLKTLTCKTLTPKGAEAASAVPYLCQLRYDPDNDLVLVGGTLSPDKNGVRRTPAYDCAGDRWVSLKIVGDDPSGKSGRNVSLGMIHDAKRKLFWAVDTNSHVFTLRLDAAKADVRLLE